MHTGAPWYTIKHSFWFESMNRWSGCAFCARQSKCIHFGHAAKVNAAEAIFYKRTITSAVSVTSADFMTPHNLESTWKLDLENLQENKIGRAVCSTLFYQVTLLTKVDLKSLAMTVLCSQKH